MPRSHIDLNSDMGESFGHWRLGDDEGLMKYISSANIAGGFHAGDPHTMHRVVRLAKEHGVALGIHPGYRDVVGFGRRHLDASPDEVRDEVLYQLGALREFARYYGLKVQHVKLHGALYMRAAKDAALSRAVIEAIQRVDSQLIIYCMRASETYEVAVQLGQPVVAEFYADRDYNEDGTIVFARSVGRMDPEAVAEKVLRAVREGKVRAVSGADIDIQFDSVCVHSDTPGAVELARAIHDRLKANGVEIRAPSRTG